MLAEVCAMLWCEAAPLQQQKDICTLSRVPRRVYSESREKQDFRDVPIIINGEIEFYRQKLERKLGCWLERISD